MYVPGIFNCLNKSHLFVTSIGNEMNSARRFQIAGRKWVAKTGTEIKKINEEGNKR